MRDPIILICVLVWIVGMVIAFRLEAKRLIRKENKRRYQAIEAAAVTAPWWPLLVLGLLVIGAWWLVKTVLLAGIPESQADRDARTKELERELEVPLEEALKAATATEELPPDTTLGDVLAAAHKDKEKLPEGFFQTRCARCGCDVVPGRTGYVHVPSLGGRWPCSRAVVEAEEASERLTPAERVLDLLHKLKAHGVEKDPTSALTITTAIHKAEDRLELERQGMDDIDHALATRAKRLIRCLRAVELSGSKAVLGVEYRSKCSHGAYMTCKRCR